MYPSIWNLREDLLLVGFGILSQLYNRSMVDGPDDIPEDWDTVFWQTQKNHMEQNRLIIQRK